MAGEYYRYTEYLKARSVYFAIVAPVPFITQQQLLWWMLPYLLLLVWAGLSLCWLLGLLIYRVDGTHSKKLSKALFKLR